MLNQNAQRDAKIMEWQKAVKALNEYKVLEAELRKEVLRTVYDFNTETLREGTENIDLGSGYKLKAVFKTTRKLNDGAEGEDLIEQTLQKIEKSCAEGEFLAERLVKWKAELSTTEYKKAPDHVRALIDEIVISSPATPSLELVAPKSK